MSIAFRHSAGFGKRIEYWIIGLMLKQGLDVYLPLVDDDAIDAVIKRPDGNFVQVQIKARSSTVKLGDCALLKNRDRPRLISPNMVLQPKLVSLSLNRLG